VVGFVFQCSNSRIGEKDMKIGDTVRVDKCDVCEAVIGKTGKIKNFADDKTMVALNFGKGRPPMGRPHSFPVGDLTNVSDPVAEVNV
jgi:hypothetical protein